LGFLNYPKNTKANLKKIWSTWGTNLRTNCPNHTFRMVWFEGLLVTNTKTNPTPDIDSRPYINSHILKQYCTTPTYLAFCHTEWDPIFIYHRKRYRKSMFLCFEESKSKIFLNAHFPKYSHICLSQMSTHLIFNLQSTLIDIDHRSCNLNISSSFV